MCFRVSSQSECSQRVFIHVLSAHFKVSFIIGMKYFVLPWKHTQMYIFDLWTVLEEKCLNYKI